MACMRTSSSAFGNCRSCPCQYLRYVSERASVRPLRRLHHLLGNPPPAPRFCFRNQLNGIDCISDSRDPHDGVSRNYGKLRNVPSRIKSRARDHRPGLGGRRCLGLVLQGIEAQGPRGPLTMYPYALSQSRQICLDLLGRRSNRLHLWTRRPPPCSDHQPKDRRSYLSQYPLSALRK